MGITEAKRVSHPNWVERVEYTFRAPPGTSVEDLGNFLTAHVHRTVVGHYPEEFQFQAAAYHRRVRAGTKGFLKIGQESIQLSATGRVIPEPGSIGTSKPLEGPIRSASA
jgi:hypothetical protein